MSGHGSKLTRKTEEDVASLFTQRNQEAGAVSAVAPATCGGKLPQFKAADAGAPVTRI